MKKQTNWTPVREYVRDCLYELSGYTNGNVGDTEKLVDRVRAIFRDTPYVNTDSKVHKAHPKVIKNITVLVSLFNAEPNAVKDLLCNDDPRKLIRALEELKSKSEILASASDFVPVINNWLQEGISIEDFQLDELIKPSRIKTNSKMIIGGVEDVQALEEIDSLDDDELSINAICKKVEIHIGLGNLKLANDFLHDGLAKDEQHAGLWFQKARLFLKLSAVENQKAFMNRLYKVEIAEPMSGQEEMYQQLEDEAETKAFEFKEQVFDACIKAMSLLPAKEVWGEQAREWSEKFGNYLDLRREVIQLIIREAGTRCMPFDNGRNDRVLARLGRCTHYPYLGKPLDEDIGEDRFQKAIDHDANERLSKEPIFSIETDIVISDVCDEWRENRLSDRARYNLDMRLLFLNIVRAFQPSKYVDEVSLFIERIKQSHPSETYKFFSRFDGFKENCGQWNWGTVLHDHLDCILTRDEQRELIRNEYSSYIKSIQDDCHDALCSVYDDEIRIAFENKKIEQVYELACKAEEDRIYRRENDKEALRLKRSAQWARLNAQQQNKQELVENINSSHLNDRKMSDRAEKYFKSQYDFNDMDEYIPDFFEDIYFEA